MAVGSEVQKVAFLGGRHHMVLRKILVILFLVQLEDLVHRNLLPPKQS